MVLAWQALYGFELAIKIYFIIFTTNFESDFNFKCIFQVKPIFSFKFISYSFSSRIAKNYCFDKGLGNAGNNQRSQMNIGKSRAKTSLTICLLFFVMFLQYGCMAASALKGKQGLDVSTFKVGLNKADVEEILGSPVREWLTSSSIHYCVYDYDAGVPPSSAGAAGHIFMDIATLGVWEIFGAFVGLPEFRKRERMAISYDADDIVIGVFDHFGDFDVLPVDGCAPE